jgi:hypothetical protein
MPGLAAGKRSGDAPGRQVADTRNRTDKDPDREISPPEAGNTKTFREQHFRK